MPKLIGMDRVSKSMDLARMTRMALACAGCAVGLLSFNAPSSSAAVNLQGAVPVLYTYNLNWSPGKRVLSGSSAILVENRGPGPIDRVWLHLRPNAGDRLEAISHQRLRVRGRKGLIQDKARGRGSD